MANHRRYPYAEAEASGPDYPSLGAAVALAGSLVSASRYLCVYRKRGPYCSGGRIAYGFESDVAMSFWSTYAPSSVTRKRSNKANAPRKMG